MTGVMSACTGQPVSWLALERHALGQLEPARAAGVAGHLEECAACRAALAVISSDRRALPPLPDLALAAARRRRVRRTRAAAGGALLAAAAALLLVWRGRDPERGSIAGLKGGDEIAIVLVRERGGAIDLDPPGFRAGDRFKVLVTCARAGLTAVDVSVRQGASLDRPLPRASIRCGNRVPLPGAFRLTGSEPALLCVEADGARECRVVQPD